MWPIEVINHMNEKGDGFEALTPSDKGRDDTMYLKRISRRKALLARHNCECIPTEKAGVIININCPVHGGP